MFRKKATGIFLGSEGVSIVETSEIGKIKNYIYNSYPKDITKPAGPATPKDNIFDVFLDNEVEIVAFLQRSIRDSRVNLENNEICVCIPNRDLIVRFFEIPHIPKKDLNASIGFEIKKYIPFRTEEITYDYQTRPQKNIIEILFAGIKNEDLQKYKSILAQLKVNIVAIEPSQFSILRLLKIKKMVSNREAVVIAELERGEGIISIIDNGIPTFSRDIKIASVPEATESDTETISFRIINEVRVSIDYFRRQFLKKGIERILLLSKEESKDLINTFNKELGIPIQYKNPDDVFGIKEEHSLSLAKALGASHRASRPSSLIISLGKKEKVVSKALFSSQQIISETLAEILDIPKATIIKGISFIVLALALIFIWGNLKIKPLSEEFNAIRQKANSILTDEAKGLDVETLNSRMQVSKDKLNAIKGAFQKDFIISEKLDVLPNLMPEGLWVEEVSFDKDNKSLYLRGVVFRENDKQAAEAPYTFVSNLKNSPLFFNKVKSISAKSLRSDIQNNYKVIRFEIDIKLDF